MVGLAGSGNHLVVKLTEKVDDGVHEVSVEKQKVLELRL